MQSYYQEKYGCSLPISLVVSVGTGIQPESPLGNTDLLQTNSWFFFLSEISLMAEKAKNLLSLLTSAVCCSVCFIFKTIFIYVAWQCSYYCYLCTYLFLNC